jgi:predicted porin
LENKLEEKMQKKLLGIAIAAALANGAFAQTNVTVYGVVDLGLSHDNNGGAAGSVTRLDSGILNGSRLGFIGTEDLGGGLSASFTLENGFSADNGNLGQGGRLFGRQAWLGLNGGFGSVRLGRQNTPVYANSLTFDPFVNALAGDSARLFNYSGARTDNAISYNYDANGVRAQLMYGFGEAAGNSSSGRTIAGFAGYKNGPIDVVLTYTGNNDVTGNVTGKTTMVGGNYNFGPAAVYLAYAWNKDVIAPSGVVAAGADTRNALLGVAVPFGAGTFKASYIKLSDKATSNADANQIAIGYVHDLSKRTALYTSFSRTANDGGAKYNTDTGGATDKLFDVGIRHKF